MRVPNFVFGTYESQAKTADQERTVNWYPEPIESPGASSRMALYPTPGVTLLATGASDPGRAHFYENEREFAVIGSIFYEIDNLGNLTNRGTVAIDTQPATISSNGDGGGQLFITSGTNGYYFDLTTNTLTQIAALDGKATMGDHLDGYFLALDASTSTLYISALLDGSSWTTGTDFAQRSIAPDPWKSMKVNGRYIWLLGEQTSEIWYNVGTTFPFAPHPSGLVEHGVAAAFSVVTANQSIMWLGSSSLGEGYVLQAQGFSPQVVSNYALQTATNGYDVLSDAQAYAYSDLGHTFYVLNFVTENTTWAYDLNLGSLSWTERGTWITEENKFVAWRPRWHVWAYGEHRVLDSQSGKLYQMSMDSLSDVDSRAIRRLRRAPVIQTEDERLFFSSLTLDLENGLGTQTGQGANPQVMMRMSDDGGRTWGPERMRPAGKVGKYGHRVRWNRLGSSRKRVYEVSVTDPIPWRLTDAFVELGQGAITSPVQAGGGRG